MIKCFSEEIKKILGDELKEGWEQDVPSRVKIIEVATRDGFQAEKHIVPTEKKIEIINAISKSGVTAIEVTSFVRGDVIPQLADAREVMKKIQRMDNIVYSVLVPNMRGAQNALECGADEWGLMISLSEEHSRANVNCSRDESIEKAKEIVEYGHANGVRINGGILTAFQGNDAVEVSLERIIPLIDIYCQMGISIINVADTEGCAVPKEVHRIMRYLRRRYPEVEFVGHFHDTSHLAMENALAALAAGVYTFDCAIGGMGGCPAVPHAGGNLSTENFVRRLYEMEIETGVDLQKLQKVKELLSTALHRDLQ